MTESAHQSPILHELAAIRNYLLAAQDVVKSGHMPDMTGLENRIAVLCEAIQQAPPDVQGECLPQLHILIEQLNACEQAMRKSQNVAESINQ
jgi:hypothetical protein